MVKTRLLRAGLLVHLVLASGCAGIWGFGDLTVGGASDASTADDSTTGGGDGPASVEDGSPAEGSADVSDASTAQQPDADASPDAGEAGVTVTDADATATTGDAADATSPDAPVSNEAGDAASAPDSDGASPADAPAESGLTYSLSVTLVTYGPTTGTLGSTPSGISCSAGCTQAIQLPAGSPVHLAVTGASGTLMRWSGACTGTAATCDLTMNAATSVRLVLNAYNYAFVTSSTQAGDFGGLNPVDAGLPAADSMCAQAAASANLPGTFKAYFSTASVSARSRLGSARGWIRVDGAPVFDTVTKMDTGTMYYPLNLDENGQRAAAEQCVWTASSLDGTYYGGTVGTCNGWTSAASTDFALIGVASWESGGWSCTNTATRCNSSCAVYCLGTDLTAAVAAPTSTGRIAFLSTGTWTPSSGVAAANSLCNLEASGASLSGTYAALLATPTASAMSAGGFSLVGATWVRPDGVPVAANPSAFAVGNLQSAIDVHADSTYQSVQSSVWTGASSPSIPGTDSTTCSGWTAADASAAYSSTIQGKPNDLSTQFFDLVGYATDCSTPRQVYCLEQ